MPAALHRKASWVLVEDSLLGSMEALRKDYGIEYHARFRQTFQAAGIYFEDRKAERLLDHVVASGGGASTDQTADPSHVDPQKLEAAVAADLKSELINLVLSCYFDVQWKRLAEECPKYQPVVADMKAKYGSNMDCWPKVCCGAKFKPWAKGASEVIELKMPDGVWVAIMAASLP